MPTLEQQKELIDNCTYEWTTENGVEGCKFTCNNSGASIFLPAAGCRVLNDPDYASYYGHYWSSTSHPSYSNINYELSFGTGYKAKTITNESIVGRSVRPVSR